jgi:mannose-6-phosphate isomerase-like protein (cupin superfamily)
MPEDSSRDRLVLRARDVEPVPRGAGVRTFPLVGPWNADGDGVTSGITEFEPGVGIPLHTHNVDETVLVLEGRAAFQLGDEDLELGVGDATWVAAGVPHRFRNPGPGRLRFHWVYSARHITRTICETGETVVHLSAEDRNTTSR